MKPQTENLSEMSGLPRQLLRGRNQVPEAPEPKIDGKSISPSIQERIRAEVRDHALGYSVLAVFTLAGPVVAHLLFPDAPTALAIIGGFAFGAYGTFCAVFDKFL